jgi:predicted adenylyl cyclase CyaB
MQGIEIELKFQVNDNQIISLSEKIELLWFISQWKKHEKTIMYDNRDFLMQKTNGRIRLRISWDLCELSYKKPLMDDSGIKKEIEHETSVGNAEVMNNILNDMDYFEVSSYERYRTTFLSNKSDVKITIDEYPFDNYLEIEGAEEEIISIGEFLKYTIEDNLTKPCDTLFNERRKAHGLEQTFVMSFDAFDKE